MTEVEKKYKVFLVDDDEFLVDMYTTKFGHSDIAINACKSGEVLLEKLKAKESADLILLDIVMPNMSGLETLAEIRRAKLATDIPVMMLTNQNDEKDISEAQKLGVAGYIVKAAATPSEVVAEIMKIIKNK